MEDEGIDNKKENGNVSNGKQFHLLIREEIICLLQQHFFPNSNALEAGTDPDVIMLIQKAITLVSQKLILDMCTYKKENIATFKHLSINGSDVGKAVWNLAERTDLPEHKFYKYASPLAPELSTEEICRNKDKASPLGDLRKQDADKPQKTPAIVKRRKLNLSKTVVPVNGSFVKSFNEGFLRID